MAYYLSWEFLGYITPYSASGYSSVTCNPQTGALSFSGSASLTPDSTSGSVIINSGGDPVQLIASPSRSWESYIGSVEYEPDPIYPAYIYHNGDWRPATPYIYHNGDWVPATPNIYSGGWK